MFLFLYFVCNTVLLICKFLQESLHPEKVKSNELAPNTLWVSCWFASDHDEYDSQLESSSSELEEIWSSDEEDAEAISEWIPYSAEWDLLNRDSNNQPQSKINKELIEYSEPIHYFLLFLGEGFLEEICRLKELYDKRNTKIKTLKNSRPLKY